MTAWTIGIQRIELPARGACSQRCDPICPSSRVTCARPAAASSSLRRAAFELALQALRRRRGRLRRRTGNSRAPPASPIESGASRVASPSACARRVTAPRGGAVIGQRKEIRVASRELRPGDCEVRIEPHGALRMRRWRRGSPTPCAWCVRRTPAHAGRRRRRPAFAVGARRDRTRRSSAVRRACSAARHGLRDLALDREDVRGRAFVGLRPELPVASAASINETLTRTASPARCTLP